MRFAAQCGALKGSRTPAWLALAGLGWAGILAAGIFLLLRYDFSPGAVSGTFPDRWPIDSGLTHQPGMPTLVMAVHPGCPCSRASVEQLGQLVSRSEPRFQAVVLFFDAPELEDSRFQSGHWTGLANHPRIQAVVDADGRMARRFGMETSGEALLYDAAGHLRFHGGLTPSRGHSGSGKGVDMILALAAGHEPALASAPVFGCSLLETN